MTTKISQKALVQASIIALVKQGLDTSELISTLEKTYGLSQDSAINLLLELEHENTLKFSKKESAHTSIRSYLFSSQAIWFSLSILLIVAAALFIFLPVSELTAPFRFVFGFILAYVLPGYLLTKAAFPDKLPINNISENILLVERVIFIIALDVTITPFVAAALNFSPWGIQVTSLTSAIAVVTVVFAALALVRQFSLINIKKT